MSMAEYETTVIMRPDVSGESIEGTLDKVRSVVKQDGGKLIAMNHWGRRKLAYDIAKQSRGIYVHAHYLGENALVAEIERNLRISDNVMRFLTVKVADGINPDDRQEKEYVRPEYDAEDSAMGQHGDLDDDDAALGGDLAAAGGDLDDDADDVSGDDDEAEAAAGDPEKE